MAQADTSTHELRVERDSLQGPIPFQTSYAFRQEILPAPARTEFSLGAVKLNPRNGTDSFHSTPQC
jgi:hypothetical protein